MQRLWPNSSSSAHQLPAPPAVWKDDDYDVLADGVVVGRLFNSAASSVGLPWMWTYGFNPLERRPTHGYEPMREAAMAAFAKNWRRE